MRTSAEAIALLSGSAGPCGAFLDFDGTLSEIVDDPARAVAVEGALDVLESLAARIALVAVVSGRSLEDLRSRLPARGVLLAGAYGRERSDNLERPPTQGWETVAVAASAAAAGMPGVLVERKGAGVSLHFRRAPRLGDEVRALAETLASEFSLDVRAGRMVFELVVPGPGKGDAIARLVGERRLKAVLVAGDDLADVESFQAVRDLDVTSVLLAVASEEAPPELRDASDASVGSPRELVAFLEELVRLL